MISHHLEIYFIPKKVKSNQTPLQELFNLRWHIQHLIDESQSDDDDDGFDNPLSEDNWMLQANWKFIKYVIHKKHSMTPKQLKKNPIKPIIKVHPNQECDIDEGESSIDEEEFTTSTELSEHSTSDAPTEATEDSKPIQTSQVHNVFNKSIHDENDSHHDKSVTEFEPMK